MRVSTLLKGVTCFKNFCLGQRLRTFVQKFLISGTIHSPSQRHSHLILDPGSAFYDHFRGGEAPSELVVICRSMIQDQVAVAVAVAVDFHLENKNLLAKSSYSSKINKFLFHIVPFIIVCI